MCTTWAVKQKKYYLLDVWRGRLKITDLLPKIKKHALHYKAQAILIENPGLGLQLVQTLIQDTTPGFPRPIGITPVGDKKVRMEGQSNLVEAGHVLLPNDAPWMAVFLEELLAFPNNKHDDQVDSFSQFLNWEWNRTRRGKVSIFGCEVIEMEDPPPY